MPKTAFDKIWDAHCVTTTPGNSDVLFIDRHFIHEVTSPQAFNTLEERGLAVKYPEKVTATADHNVPTIDQHLPIREELSREQVRQLRVNCQKHNIEYYGLTHARQGIVHVIGPELGLSRPGMTIVCGDSHTSTHGAFGCVAFGIGTSQVAHVLASQCLIQRRPKTMRITVNGKLADGVTAKDIILFIIAQLGTSAGTGYFVEYAGEAIRNLSMEGRMTICNMSIEMGAPGGLVAPDEITYAYLKNRPYAPQENWEAAVSAWDTLKTDPQAKFDQEYTFAAADIPPMVTYGTNPGMGVGIHESVPTDTKAAESFDKSLAYMGFTKGEKILGKKINHVFIGSCTNSRIEDLRLAANFVRGRKTAAHVRAMVIPGSKQVERQAVDEGLREIFVEAGFEFREPGCSACLGMNEDKIPSGAYCVSTSNRNFEGRQGPGARTILASPLTAAAAAIAGELVDVREMLTTEIQNI